MAKNISNLLFALTVTAGIAVSNGARAEDCSQYYRFDTSTLKENHAVTIAMLLTVTRENYEERRKGFDSSLGVTYQGIPMQGTGNYEDFEEARSKYLSELQFDMDQQHAIEIAEANVNAQSAANVATCLRAQSALNRGLHAWLLSSAGNVVVVEVFYNASSAAGSIEIRANVTGGTIGFEGPVRMKPGDFTSFEAERAGPEEDFTITVKPTSPGERTQHVAIPKLPKITPPPPPPDPTPRDNIIAALKDGKTCSIRVVIPGNQFCFGTIVRGSSKPHTIKYLRGNNWQVYGQRCDHAYQTGTYRLGNPDGNAFSFWGEPFDIDENGWATARKANHVGGQITCP